MKAVAAAFNQEKALVGAFSVITNLRMELFEALMLGFVTTPEFRALNVGCGLDEGMASGAESAVVPLYYGERSCFWVEVTCRGSPGHGSRFLDNTAAEKARRVINRLLEFRDAEQRRLEADPRLTEGDVTSVNLTLMQGGVQVRA